MNLNFLLLLRIYITTAGSDVKEAPCNYRDTVPLNSSEILEDGSYNFEGIIIPADQIGTYDYEINVENIRIPTDLHTRGCICHIRPCISLCCPPEADELVGSNCTPSLYVPSDDIYITTNQGTSVVKNISESFVTQYYRPCESMFSFVGGSILRFNYSIFENGSLIYDDEDKLFTKDEYCLSPIMLESNYTRTVYEYSYSPYKCHVQS